MKTRVIFFIFAFSAIFSEVFAVVKWQNNIVNYDRGLYQAGFQNWQITQSKKGWMYFANSKGLLEFDGVYWTLYPVRNKILHSLKICDTTLYVGGSAEFGFFEKTKQGKIAYHSLSDTLPTWGGEVWNIVQIDSNIYFLADNFIFILDTKTHKINTIALGIKIDYCSTAIGKTLYIATTQGLYFLNKQNKVELLPNAAALSGQKIVGISPYKNKIFITTSNSGIYELENGACKKISTAADGFIRQNQIFCAAISGNTMALGSVASGALIFNLATGDEPKLLNLANGLLNNTVLSIYFDTDNNLWLGLDKGISYINLNSPAEPLFSVSSPIGTGYCSMVYDGDLYFGTNQGLYKADSNGTLRMLPNSEGQIWSMSIIDGDLFAAGDNGITVVSQSGNYKINTAGLWGVQPMQANPNMLIAGAYQGFRLIDKAGGQWLRARIVYNFPNSCRGFLEDDIQNDFWVANAGGDMERVTIDPVNALIVRHKAYKIENSNIGENNTVQRIFGNLVVCGKTGIFMYDRIADAFVPYTQLENMLEGQKYYDFLHLDKFNNFWYVCDGRLKMLRWTNGTYASHPVDWGMHNDLIENFVNISFWDENNAVAAVEKGYIKININKKRENRTPASVFIKHIIAARNGETMDYYVDNEDITIPYAHNSLNIMYGATNFANAGDLRYSYRLTGQDNQWSTPASSTTKEYTGLVEGTYVFEVKAFTDGNEKDAITASIQFRILPPWYRSIKAYIIYLLILCLLVYYVYKKTISKQKRIIRQKEQTLQKQSKIHEEEKMLKDKTIDQLLNENLQKDLNYKTQELSGYVLNLIRKNQMLENVKKEVTGISKAIDEGKQTSTIKQKIVKLTSQINNNIDHDDDFEVFKSNFDIVHKDFFKTLDKCFPCLSRNEKVLCAYLKMNLSSKEIAMLQNISLRGVEINRYRLRKKMNLERQTNLTEFIQKL
ncbi:MAG: hypothetical protein LBS01_11340 [Prevotellaceae bacterium]|jgi:ligand-binding sensor domain-containing protein/DNA-binding CsgD family transcriptional regulator|nr:hypothetical protein [Prevotellaceae bacterium]